MQFLFLILSFLAIPQNEIMPTKNQTYWTWNDTNIHYLEKGKGNQHVVLLHGFAATTYTWHAQIDELAKRGYHVWALDFFGFGESDKPTDIDYTIDLYREMVVAFMDGNGIEKAHLVGHSMGGGISLNLAVFAPEKLRTLTLIDPAGIPLKLPLSYAVGKFFGKFAAVFMTQEYVHKILKQLYFDPSKITQEQIDEYSRPLQMPGGKEAPLKVLRAFDNKMLVHQSQYYHQIQLPVLLVWGENDRWLPVSNLDLYDMPNAEKISLPECGHAPQEEKPEQFNPIFFKFIGKNDIVS